MIKALIKHRYISEAEDDGAVKSFLRALLVRITLPILNEVY